MIFFLIYSYVYVLYFYVYIRLSWSFLVKEIAIQIGVLLIFVQAYFNFKVEYTCTTSVIPLHILFQWPRNRLILVLNIFARYFNYMDIYLN